MYLHDKVRLLHERGIQSASKHVQAPCELDGGPKMSCWKILTSAHCLGPWVHRQPISSSRELALHLRGKVSDATGSSDAGSSCRTGQ